MEEKENDNIYIYREEDQDTPAENAGEAVAEASDGQQPGEEYGDLDNSGPNFSQVDPESDALSAETRHREGKDCPIVLMLKVMFNPVEGWKNVRRSKVTPEEFQRECFYPLLAVFAASKFLNLVYSVTAKLQEVIVEALVDFVSFFLGYFCILILLRLLLKGSGKKAFDSDFGKVFLLLALSTLCLFFTITNVLPMLWDLLIFLPLWTIYIECRGVRFFKFEHQRQMSATVWICLLTLGVPVALSWLFGAILPV